jgi:hypothetical protein
MAIDGGGGAPGSSGRGERRHGGSGSGRQQQQQQHHQVCRELVALRAFLGVAWTTRLTGPLPLTPAPPCSQPPAPADGGQHQHQHQQQQQQQLAALKAALQAEQVSRAAADSRAEALRAKLREVAERSKARGNQLAGVLAAVRRVAESKQALVAAEGDLQRLLAAADAFLQVKGGGAAREEARFVGRQACEELQAC